MFRKGMLGKIRTEMKRMHFNIFGISESSCLGAEPCHSDEVTTFYSEGEQYQRGDKIDDIVLGISGNCDEFQAV